MNPDEMQMNETIDKTESRICKLFGVPESMISAKANKYNTVGQNSLHFLKHTLASILVAIEQSLDRQLLTDTEKRKKVISSDSTQANCYVLLKRTHRNRSNWSRKGITNNQ